MRIVAIGIELQLGSHANSRACFVIQLRVLKGVQVELVKELYSITFSYEVTCVIRKYPIRLFTNEIGPFMSTE